MNDKLPILSYIRDLESRMANAESRIGINKENLSIGGGLVEENKQIKSDIKDIKNRLTEIEKYEIQTNNIVDSILEKQEELVKVQTKSAYYQKVYMFILIGIVVYFGARDILSGDTIKLILDLIKKFT